uniref:Uncharacterized protein n=1 Tax=viral metagenome TaxID=1070528 RepID=A0A6H1ZQ82_9ZZZZ
MKLIAKFNEKWMMVDTETKTWEWVERATPDIEEKILHDCTITGLLTQKTNKDDTIIAENMRDYWKHQAAGAD